MRCEIIHSRSHDFTSVSFITLLLVLTALPTTAQVPVFGPTVNYDSGGGSFGVAVADLNHDGKPDVVVANPNPGTVSILLGNGHGWFGPPLTYNSGAHLPWSVAIGDVNGDGVPDIVVANNAIQNCGIGVLLGKGDGTFQPAVLYGSSAVCQASSVVIADFNGDGKLDIAVGETYDVAILLGNGDGTFQPALISPSAGIIGGPNSLAVADVNGDGKADLVAAIGSLNYPNGPGTVAVLLGNGNGTFRPATDYDSGGNNANTLAIGDVNGDGRPDIVVTNVCPSYACGNVSVLLGNGDGTFQSAISYATGGLIPSVALADINGDGKLDLVMANKCGFSSCSAGTVGILVGNGTGTFQPAVAYKPGGLVLQAVVADVNADGKPDVVIAKSASVGALLTETGPATETAVTTSGSPSVVGQAVTFTATVSSTHGTMQDGEVVAFYDGITMLGSAKLASGTASFVTSSLAAKSHTIKATYVGDATFSLSNGNVHQAVNPYPTSATLSTSPNPSNYGGAVTLTAHVTTSSSSPLSGTVAFKDGTVSLGTGSVDSGGMATLSTTKLPLGSDLLTVTYNGDPVNGKSTSSAVTQVVNQAHISMSLSSSPSPSTQGKSVKFTATLTSTGGLPTGQSLTLSYNGTTLGTKTVTGSGIVTFFITTLPAGTDVVTATYAGDAGHSAASASVTQTVN